MRQTTNINLWQGISLYDEYRSNRIPFGASASTY